MRRAASALLSSSVLAALLSATALSCGREGDADPGKVAVPGRTDALKTAAALRAERRAFDGAPPVIPHAPMGAACVSCHDPKGMAIAGLGFAPPSPHEHTEGLSALSRCEQCHVYRATHERFVPSTFVGLRQVLLPGPRAHEAAPPRIPHPYFMRENCLACHSGPAAREEVRTTHPERANCLQCHVPIHTEALFER